MRGAGKTAKDQDYEDHLLHHTIGGSRIRSHTAKYGSHKIHRHQLTSNASSPSALPSATDASAPGAAGTSASSVSSYLENMPSVTLDDAAPPRPPRPPGGLLGISNGRGIGYGRTLGSSYDSPFTIQESFNGHVRSGANLYGGRSHASGLFPANSSAAASSSSLVSSGASHAHRPTLSVFPLQKALEIAVKESRLLAAASSRGGSGSSGTGRMNTHSNIASVPEPTRLARAHGGSPTRHTLGGDKRVGKDKDPAHPPSPDPGGARSPGQRDRNQDRDQGDHVMGTFEPKTTTRFQPLDVGDNTFLSHDATGMHDHMQEDMRSQYPPIASYPSRTHYPGIASLSHHPKGVLSLWTHPSQQTSGTFAWPWKGGWDSNPGWSSHDESHALLESAVHAVRALLDSYPAPSPYCVDDKKRSPLHFAAASGDLELVEFLLDRGVRPDCGRDIAGNMPLHLAIISNRIDVVAALLKAGADMTLASPMTHKTPLDLAESRLSYLLARAQESVKRSQSSGAGAGAIDLYNTQVATRSSFTSHHGPSTTSPALLSQIRGIVNLLRPYVVRQQKLQHGDHALERGKERSWEKADRYMRNLDDGSGGGNGGRGTWRSDPHSEDNFGDMEDEAEGGDDDDEDEGDQMDTGERRRRPVRRRAPRVDMDDDMDVQVKGGFKSKRATRRAGRRMDADETEVALENLMNGLSLLEANRKQHEQQQQQQGQQQQQEQQVSVSDSADGNLADNELDPRSEEVDEGLPDLLEQVQQVLEAIKLNESQS